MKNNTLNSITPRLVQIGVTDKTHLAPVPCSSFTFHNESGLAMNETLDLMASLY